MRDAHEVLYSQVCTTFLALSLIEEGYTVYANAEASGALSERIANDANDRMRAAGVYVLSSFAVVCDLMRDWRNTPGSLELLPYFDKWAATLWYLYKMTLWHWWPLSLKVSRYLWIPCSWPCCCRQSWYHSSRRIWVISPSQVENKFSPE